LYPRRLRGQGGSDRAFQGRSLLPVALGAPGKPVSDVPIFVTPEPGTAAGEPVWTCASEAMREPVSGADGSFVVQIDPGVPVKIDAGWKNYPIGTASRTLRGKPDGEIVLALK